MVYNKLGYLAHFSCRLHRGIKAKRICKPMSVRLCVFYNAAVVKGFCTEPACAFHLNFTRLRTVSLLNNISNADPVVSWTTFNI